MNSVPPAPNDLLTPAEVASLLYVDPKTVSRWAMAGKIRSIRTPGGHRRFLRSEIEAMIEVGDFESRADSPPVIVRTSASTPWPSDHDGSVRAHQVAAGVVAEAVSVAARAQADYASADLVEASDAVVAAARRTAAAARRSREGRAQAAEEAAEVIADRAFRSATDLKLRADASARQLTQAATEAAALVASTGAEGHHEDDVAAARTLAAHVKAAAVSVAEDSAEAAVRVADAVTAAAAAVASTVSVTDVEIEGEVARVAAALQFAASAQARHVAAETDARATAAAIVARDAARAVRRRDLDADLDPETKQRSQIQRLDH